VPCLRVAWTPEEQSVQLRKRSRGGGGWQKVGTVATSPYVDRDVGEGRETCYQGRTKDDDTGWTEAVCAIP